MSNQIIVLSNDILPYSQYPVAGPGLRAYGIAEGLKRHGYDVKIVAPADVRLFLEEKYGFLPKPSINRSNEFYLYYENLGDYLNLISPAAIIYTNYSKAHLLSKWKQTYKNDCIFVYDFFAPQLLEYQNNLEVNSNKKPRALEKQKLLGLSIADIIAVNGEKKIDYVNEWINKSLEQSSNKNKGIVYLPMCFPDNFNLYNRAKVISKNIISLGYQHGWDENFNSLNSFTSSISNTLFENDWRILTTNEKHWLEKTDHEKTLEEISKYFISLPIITWGRMQNLLSDSMLWLDLFDKNTERELAMVTRSIIALIHGVPIIHPRYTEVGNLMEKYQVGFLYDNKDEVVDIMKKIAQNPEILVDSNKNLPFLYRDNLEPKAATKELAYALSQFGILPNISLEE